MDLLVYVLQQVLVIILGHQACTGLVLLLFQLLSNPVNIGREQGEVCVVSFS
jgi:hypothetical protein